MSNLVDDFLAGLEGDKTQEFTASDHIMKVLMSAQDNQGTVVLAPFKGPNGKFYTLLEGVKEYNGVCSLFKNGGQEAWLKILPKNAYGELSQEELDLYQEVSGLFDEVYDLKVSQSSEAWRKIRIRKYSLFMGVLMKHVNRNNEEIKDNKGKAVLLIFPSKSPVDAMATSVNAKINAMNGSKEWIPAVFAPGNEGRQGVMSITFKKPTSPGYDSNVGFEFNSSYVTLVDPKGFSEDVIKMFGDPVDDFLSWQHGKTSKFNADLFKELKAALTMELKGKEKPAEPSESAPNQNGVDPMINPAQTTVPNETPTPGAIKGEDDLPF